MQRALTSGPITGSILLGLCIGSGVAISMQYGSGEYDKMRQSVFQPSSSLRAWRWRTPSASATIW